MNQRKMRGSVAAGRRRRAMPTLLLALLAAGCVNRQELATSVDNVTREKLAAAAQEAGDPEGALALLSVGAAKGSDPGLQLRYAAALVAAGRQAEGMRAAERVRAARPGDLAIARQVGRLAVQAHDGTEAAGAFQAIVARKPQDPEALDGLGIGYALQGKLPAATAAFRLAVQQDPANVAARNNLALSYALSGQADQAIPLLQAISGTTGGDRVRHNLALAYAARGDATDAETLLAPELGTQRAAATVGAYGQLARSGGAEATSGLAPVQVPDPMTASR